MERFAWRLFLAAILWCFSASSHRIERNTDRVLELNRTIDALIERRTKLEDVDECKTNQHRCHVRATCANTIGGYNCTCNLPYAGDGYSTCDLVCTPPSVLIGTLGCIRLLHTFGTPWEQADQKCKSFGATLANGIQKEHFASLFLHFGDQTMNHGIWVGAMRGKWVSTGDIISPDLFRTGYPTRGEDKHCIGLHLVKGHIGLGNYICTLPYYALCQTFFLGTGS